MYLFYEKRLKKFNKYVTVWEKVSNIIKKSKSFIAKESLECFYIPVICGKVKDELQVTSYEFKFTSYEFKSTSYELKSTS